MAIFKKNITPPDLDKIRSIIPKYTHEQKIVQKALLILSEIGEPRFNVSKHCWETNLKSKDESKLWYARGLLESLVFDPKGEKMTKSEEYE